MNQPSNERLQRIEQACAALAATGEAVTFEAVAAKAGIGRATIYRHPELHAVVREHRHNATQAVTLTGLSIEIDQLRIGLEALAAKVRRHEELLHKLNRSAKRAG